MMNIYDLGKYFEIDKTRISLKSKIDYTNMGV